MFRLYKDLERIVLDDGIVFSNRVSCTEQDESCSLKFALSLVRECSIIYNKSSETINISISGPGTNYPINLQLRLSNLNNQTDIIKFVESFNVFYPLTRIDDQSLEKVRFFNQGSTFYSLIICAAAACVRHAYVRIRDRIPAGTFMLGTHPRLGEFFNGRMLKDRDPILRKICQLTLDDDKFIKDFTDFQCMVAEDDFYRINSVAVSLRLLASEATNVLRDHLFSWQAPNFS